ncbi:hypothetical protein ACGFNU_13760 [Spirillospora sp. NPDC048911]|uniref:hypothetical protein n=1 Tax=Spirillospora sp. NPDC048911 TaxID=3364527 RepID=UPI0037108B91
MLDALVDDAGLFPPTALDMADAVRRHIDDQAGRHPMLSHRFLCPASRLGELRSRLNGGHRLRVGLIADTGTDGLADALAEIDIDPRLEIALLEVPLAAILGHRPTDHATNRALADATDAALRDTADVAMRDAANTAMRHATIRAETDGAAADGAMRDAADDAAADDAAADDAIDDAAAGPMGGATNAADDAIDDAAGRATDGAADVAPAGAAADDSARATVPRAAAGTTAVGMTVGATADGTATAGAAADDSAGTTAVGTAVGAAVVGGIEDAMAIVRKVARGSVPIFFEPASYERVPETVRALQENEGLKLRCGGLRAELFPSPSTLAGALVTAVAAGVPVKATAGLHEAVRHRDPTTGFTHHGYLNLLLATAEAVAGAETYDVRTALEITDPAELTGWLKALDERAVDRLRRTFVSYGSCSTRTPIDQARDLGLGLEEGRQ